MSFALGHPRWIPWVLLTLACGCGEPPPTSEPSSSSKLFAALESGATVTRSISVGEPHFYPISLDQGDFVEITLDQNGDNMGLLLRDPVQRDVVAVDAPNGPHGQERLYFVAEAAGEHRVEVRLYGQVGGGYTLRFESRRATAEDRKRARACRLLYRGWLADEPSDRDLPEAEDALDLWRELGDEYQETVAQFRVGMLYLDRGPSGKAVESFRKALDRSEARGFRDLQPAIQIERGRALEQQGQTKDAETAFLDAALVAQELPDRWRLGLAYNELGRLLFDRRDDPWETLGFLNQAVEIFEDLNDPEQQAHALHNRGRVLNWLGREADALRDLERAREEKKGAHDVLSYAKTLRELGWVLLWQGKPGEAEARLLDALEIVKGREGKAFERETATCFDRLGTVYQHQQRWDEARTAHDRAQQAFAHLGEIQNRAHALNNLGRVETELGNLDRALKLFDLALGYFKDLEDRSGEAYALANRALVWIERRDLRAAEVDLREALDLHDSLRDEARSPGFRATYFETVHDHFQRYIEVAMALEEADPGKGWKLAALDAVERSRARSLLDLVRGLVQREKSEEKAPLEQDLRLLERKRTRLENEGESAAEELDETEARLAKLRLRLEHLEGRHVESFDLSERRDLAAIRRALDPDTALLIFALGEDRGFVWLVGPASGAADLGDSTRWGYLPAKAEIETKINDLLPRLRRRQSALSSADPRSDDLAELGEMLLGPLLADSEGASLPRRLVVIPDGPLHYLPFGALRFQGRHLLDDHEVTLLPSASVLVALRERRREQRQAQREPPRGLLAVMADPVFESFDGRLSTEAKARAAENMARGEGAELEGLARLWESGKEAEAVQSWVSETPDCRWDKLSFDANRDAMLSGHLGDFRLLHLATHAVLEDDSPELSRVVLSQFDPNGGVRPGAVYSFEIAEMDLDADLVVLSACETALGEEIRGEGLVGFPQSFFEAGADRVLVTLWKVDDRSTRELMEAFYRGLLGEGLSPGEALRRAQITVREDFDDPYFWAPFILIGDWAALPSTLLASSCLHS